jgi:HPt (histidine-containing phosphotransfer) domain-containing protein
MGRPFLHFVFSFISTQIECICGENMTSAELGMQGLDELSSVPVLDQKALNQIMEVGNGEVSLLKELLGMFEDDQSRRLDKLKEAVNSGDLGAIMDISHAIKGSAGTMGASRFRATAAMLEAHGLGHPPAAPLKVLLKLLVSAYDEARLALGEYIEKRP